MEKTVLERALASYCALPFQQKSVAFQGGEPLLYGEELLDIVEQFPVEKSIQTNATLIDTALAARFAEGGWLVGVSLDGPEDIHNATRQGSFNDAVRGIRCLERFGVAYNLLTVVSSANVRRAAEVYRFLRDNFKTRFHQYIECTGPNPEFAINGEEWGDFLIELFDEWAKNDTETISIRLFDSIASVLRRGVSTQCSFATHCRHYLVVEHDGSIYPCDFYVEDHLRLGNVMENSWEEMISSPKYENFVRAKTARLPGKCTLCEFLALCNGDCPRNRQLLCEGWKKFFWHLNA